MPDGYRNQGLSFSASHRLNPAHELGVALFSTEAWIDYDQPSFTLPTDQHRSNQEMSMLQGWWEARLVEPWKSRVTAAESKDHRTDTLNGAFANKGNTRTRQLLWDNEVRISPPHAFTVGIEGRNQTLDSASSFGGSPLRERDVSAGRLGYLGRLGAHTLQANYRYEDYSDFGAEGTYFLGYGYDLTPAWRLTLSHATAFRAPTFLDLDPAFGNPSLQPERSKTGELGVQWASGPHRLRVVYFDTEYQDAIVLDNLFIRRTCRARRTRGSRPATTACCSASTCAPRSPSRIRSSRTAPIPGAAGAAPREDAGGALRVQELRRAAARRRLALQRRAARPEHQQFDGDGVRAGVLGAEPHGALPAEQEPLFRRAAGERARRGLPAGERLQQRGARRVPHRRVAALTRA
jgi:hypothetical protein